MQKGEIVFRLFVPAHQDAPKAVHPRVGALDDPAPGFLACLVFDCLSFLATRPSMRGETKLRQDIAHFLIVIAFVEAHALRLLLRGHRALGDHTVDRGPYQFHVMPVGALHRQPNRHAVAFGQQAALDPTFGAVGRIRAGFFPPQAAPWSSRRPCSASASQCPVARQTVPPPLARVSRRRLRRPTPETGRGRWIWHTIRSDSRLPIGSRYGERKTWHRHSGDLVRVDARHQSGGCSPVPGAAVRGQPRAPQRYGTRWSCGCWVYESVYVSLVVVMYSYPIVYQVIRIGS